VIFASVVLAVALSFWATWWSLHLGRGPAPLNQSPFLRDVVEPITIVNAKETAVSILLALRARN
jgi:hypothetical protein